MEQRLISPEYQNRPNRAPIVNATKPRIVFPEYHEPIIKSAITNLKSSGANFEALDGGELTTALEMVKSSQANAIIAGINHTTRDVVLGCRDILGMSSETFSSCVFLKKPNHHPLIIADAGITKHPTEDQLVDIILQTHKTALKLLDEEPRVAMLSFSTFGSAKDPSIDQIRTTISRVKALTPKLKIDGEMQLDAAINPAAAMEKAPRSEVAGHANVLITPDLNSGNILYKALEHFGGYVAAGPILQGFNYSASDLSRSSTAEDVELTIQQTLKIIQR